MRWNTSPFFSSFNQMSRKLMDVELHWTSNFMTEILCADFKPPFGFRSKGTSAFRAARVMCVSVSVAMTSSTVHPQSSTVQHLRRSSSDFRLGCLEFCCWSSRCSLWSVCRLLVYPFARIHPPSWSHPSESSCRCFGKPVDHRSLPAGGIHKTK